MFKIAKSIKNKALILSIIAIVCIAAAAYFDAEQPTFLNDAINSVSQQKWWGDRGWTFKSSGDTLYAFWPAIIMMTIYAFSSLATGLLGSFAGSAAALYTAMYTRQGLYKKIQTFSFYEVDKFSTASLVTRLSTDVQAWQLNLQMILTMLFRMPVTATISIVNAFTPPMGNVTYGLITIGIVVFMLLIVLVIGLKVLPYFDKSRKRLDATNKIMRENILGSRVIKAFGIGDIQHDLYEKQNKALRFVNIRGQSLFLPIMIVIQFILNAGVTIILIVAGINFVHASNHPEINAGIFAFTQLIIIVLFSSLIAVMVIVMTTRTMPSIRRINEVMDTQPQIVELKSTIPLSKNYGIKFDNVNFKYNKKAKAYTLKNISFEIGSGQTLGIVGGTGSGKSTIASLIPRFYDTDNGKITIGGVDVKSAKINDIVDVVSVVLQESILFSGTIESNLKFGKENATQKEMIKACKDACAWNFIKAKQKKLESEVEQRGRNFSGGQKQRLSLARALVKKPKILILDDTTSALDLLTEAKVQENLREHYKNVTKIIISQRISSVRNADKILVLENGKVVGQGTHEHLVSHSHIYRKIVESQLGVGGFK